MDFAATSADSIYDRTALCRYYAAIFLVFSAFKRMVTAKLIPFDASKNAYDFSIAYCPDSDLTKFVKIFFPETKSSTPNREYSEQDIPSKFSALCTSSA